MEKNWVSRAPGFLDRLEGSFHGAAYTPHRHDTYAVGVTLHGIQTFDYRGATMHSQPGQMVILHPDELHDGRAGTNEGFRYKTLYIRPSAIQGVLRGQALPFIKGGVSFDTRLWAILTPLLCDFETPLSNLQCQDAIYDLATTLSTLSGQHSTKQIFNYKAAEIARRYIDETLDDDLTLDDLEHVSRQDRWQLSRDFRAAFGTSPYRYKTLRRLEQARSMLLSGDTLARTAVNCGFSDQSHSGRQFKKTYGMTPKTWLTSVRN
ncbi:MAG: AraC family transcriptional regulator [Maricaulaceae bacterium]